jgi:hypothetical protein
MVEIRYTGDELWSRIERAVEKVKDRLRRVVTALDGAGIPYAVVGGNAVQFWVSQVDEAAVRNTKDVDIAIRRRDFTAAQAALEAVGFRHRRVHDVDMFLDGPDASPRDAVHVVFAGEKVRPNYAEPAPDVEPYAAMPIGRTLPLEALVAMKLTSYRDHDRTHVRDMIEVGLIDETWLDRVPPTLRDRLQALLDDPDG